MWSSLITLDFSYVGNRHIYLSCLEYRYLEFSDLYSWVNT